MKKELIQYDFVLVDPIIPPDEAESPIIINVEDSEGEDEDYDGDVEEFIEAEVSGTYEEEIRYDSAVQEKVGADTTWTIDSKTHAAPSVTMSQYKKIVDEGFLNAPLDNVKGIVEAYGLSHEKVVEELITLSDNRLKNHLDVDISD